MRRSKNHICAGCLDDWKARQLNPTPVLLGKCGHRVSRKGVELCDQCARRARGRYDTSAFENAAEAYQRLPKPVSAKRLAAEADISWAAANRFLTLKDLPPVPTPAVAPHKGQGTEFGFQEHRRAGEPPCGDCRRAYNRAARIRARARKLGARRTPLQPCGTFGAYKRHRRRGEEPCQPCREAYRAKVREQNARRR